MKALRIMVAALGKRLGGISVSVDPRASTAYTDGKRVILPFLPDVAGIDLEDVLMGLTAHEAFHIRFTFSRGKKDGKPPAGITATPFVKEMGNCLEDPRIEHLGMKAYPGITKYLIKLISYAIRENWFPSKPEKNIHPGKLINFSVLFHFRANFLKQHDLDQTATNWAKQAVATFGQSIWDQVIAIAEKAVVASAEDAPDGPWWAAQKISDLLGMPNDLPEEQKKAASEAAQATASEMSTVDISGVSGGFMGRAKASTPDMNQETVDAGGVFADLPDVVKLESGRIYRQICGPLESKLWARSQEELFVARTGTSVVGSALHRIHTTGQVFSRRIEGDTRTIAVKVLVDVSGSMGDVRDSGCAMYAASAGSVALSKLFSSLDIAYSVSWFNRNYIKGRPFSSSPLKPNEPWKRYAGGATWIVSAISTAGIELLNETSDRKLLIVLTDGGCDQNQVMAIDNALSNEGIELRYVLIGDLKGFEFAKGRIGIGSPENVGKVLVEAFSSFAV
ncbi:hypothetical protein [Acidithiobacillus thiooxidans]|uniref:VWFA domain-containing protein n=1 Tax=Acidithiobacillus thiooxidans TaxID=930 RepID=A0A1C2IPR1_ACITH|nr:hypothetical protein [Acidithiobacillus thiooxidans]OCX69880.1 hypothetical protein A6M23_14660 [Acidithiobacillus thiooxidans]OCX77907.1 hypothetical protein A6P08_20510 [Acidithiobacillus thiooxidans]